MKKNMMHKNLHQTIRKSLGRYIAIVSIIALGAAMFVGLLSTKADMVATCQQYTDQQNMFDLRLLNPYGWTQDQADAAAQLAGLADVEAAIGLDALVQQPGGKEEAYHFCSIPERINRVELTEGRMPENETECLADAYYAKNMEIGTQITVSEGNNQETLDALGSHTYTVVGLVTTPLYMSMERGNTSIGSGSVAGYLYLEPEAFDTDYYTDLYAVLPGAYRIYSEEYRDAMEDQAEQLKIPVQSLADSRYEQLRREAEEAYEDGYQQYRDGVEEYETGKQEAADQLKKARKELWDNEVLLKEKRGELEDGKAQLQQAQKELTDGEALLAQSRQELQQAKKDAAAQMDAAEAELLEQKQTVLSALQEVSDGQIQIESGLTQINAGILQLQAGLSQMRDGQQQLEAAIALNETAIRALEAMKQRIESQPEPDQEALARLEAQLEKLNSQQQDLQGQKTELEENLELYTAQLEELEQKKAELEAQRETLAETKATLEAALSAIEEGSQQLEASRREAQQQFADAEEELSAAQEELKAGRAELEHHRQDLEAGELALTDGEAQLKQGRIDYETGRKESDRKLLDARKELESARVELLDARSQIDDMEPPEGLVLTRDTNVGYVSFESDSDIVAGVSRVFPAFFLAVAALVCITTMTRMVNEERTQIGTFKALGFGNMTIIGKYLYYSGSAALLGCGIGILIGSVVFPEILWKAYCIMYNISDWVVLEFNWKLSLAVGLIYTTVMLLVTWSCCRFSLREVPAELMRPKPPTSGKKIFMEYLPIWKRFSFLNKVAIRNIFRYRQRMFMMLLGIGGCTALLVTGFGLKGSISKVVDHQFEEVTFYDASVMLAKGQNRTQMAAFEEALDGKVDQMLFYHQSGVEVEYHNRVKDIQLIVSDDQLTDYMDLHDGKTPIAMPEPGSCVLSVGTASALGIDVGDTILIRDPDLKTMELTVSGIFENMVSNYVIITQETWTQQYGRPAAKQSVLLLAAPGQDVHELGALLSGMEDVRNVSVSADLAQRVRTLMKALDLVVILIVVCAALLAEIVLYNLTNININERIGEIATIKVLGFRSGETAAYVFKENLALSFMGAILGLGGGKLLLDFVMSQIKIDMFWMPARPGAWSFILAIAITLLSACAVDFLFYFKLERINMAEALKPVE